MKKKSEVKHLSNFMGKNQRRFRK